MSLTDGQYAHWMKRIDDIAGEHVILKEWRMAFPDDPSQRAFLIPFEHVERVGKKLREVMRQMSPRAREYDITGDQLRSLRVAYQESKDALTMWRA